MSAAEIWRRPRAGLVRRGLGAIGVAIGLIAATPALPARIDNARFVAAEIRGERLQATIAGGILPAGEPGQVQDPWAPEPAARREQLFVDGFEG